MVPVSYRWVPPVRQVVSLEVLPSVATRERGQSFSQLCYMCFLIRRVGSIKFLLDLVLDGEFAGRTDYTAARAPVGDRDHAQHIVHFI